MSESTVFARANPSGISIDEAFTYQMEVSGNPRTDRVGAPSGRIEVTVPYDGTEHFGQKPISDIETQLPDAWRRQQVTARIGYLGLSDYSKTDLDNRLQLRLNYDTFPIEVPVQGSGLQGRAAVEDDAYICTVAIEYSPEWPETVPITLTAKIYDEEWETELDLALGDDESRNRAGRELAQQAWFEHGLVFDFNLGINLPTHAGRGTPAVDYMALEWPVATSHRSVHLEVDRKDHLVTYNPERGVIEWRDIPMSSGGNETGFLQYRVPPMRLHVLQPGELFRLESLRGEVRIGLSGPVSGLGVTTFAGTGGKSDIKAKANTTIAADLTLYLEDCFDRRPFSPYQHLQFEGVILDLMRIADIETLLTDQGFRIVSKVNPEQLDLGGTTAYLLTAKRAEGIGEMRLWMLVEGTRSQTVRLKEIPGGETFSTQLETGKMVMYMRGELAGNSERLVGVMNGIQALLKERFRHVSTID